MSEQIFADAIGPIVVVGGTVRIDFVTLVPDPNEAGGRPKPVFQDRLIMPTEAFLTAARRFTEAAEAIAKLERAPAAPPNAERPAAPPVPPATVADTPAAAVPPRKPPFP